MKNLLQNNSNENTWKININHHHTYTTGFTKIKIGCNFLLRYKLRKDPLSYLGMKHFAPSPSAGTAEQYLFIKPGPSRVSVERPRQPTWPRLRRGAVIVCTEPSREERRRGGTKPRPARVFVCFESTSVFLSNRLYLFIFLERF